MENAFEGREITQLATDHPLGEKALKFNHLAGEAVAAVDAGEADLAILVNPTRVQQMVDVADAFEKMPQKSTFYFPKLPTGLVLRPVEG